MNSSQISEACDFLVNSMKSTKKASKVLGITPQTLRRYTEFNSIPSKLQELVPKIISKNDILLLYRIVPKTDDTVNIANKRCFGTRSHGTSCNNQTNGKSFQRKTKHPHQTLTRSGKIIYKSIY